MASIPTLHSVFSSLVVSSFLSHPIHAILFLSLRFSQYLSKFLTFLSSYFLHMLFSISSLLSYTVPSTVHFLSPSQPTHHFLHHLSLPLLLSNRNSLLSRSRIPSSVSLWATDLLEKCLARLTSFYSLRVRSGLRGLISLIMYSVWSLERLCTNVIVGLLGVVVSLPVSFLFSVSHGSIWSGGWRYGF